MPLGVSMKFRYLNRLESYDTLEKELEQRKNDNSWKIVTRIAAVLAQIWLLPFDRARLARSRAEVERRNKWELKILRRR